MTDGQRVLKRGFDLLVSLLFLPPALILMGLIALLIKIDSPGPVFFRQKRLGEHQQPFEILKFRTMIVNAETLKHLVERYDQDGNFLHKTPDDPRVTRVGRLLRRTHLDELPQLLNVLRGEMSLVGPRPEVAHLLEHYQDWQLKRFAVPQGLTGWWQIQENDDQPIYLSVEDDLYYVEHYSFWLDAKILLLTAWLVIKRLGKGVFSR